MENSRTKTDKKFLLTGPLSDHKVALTIYFCQNQIGTVLNADLMLNFILLKVGTGTGNCLICGIFAVAYLVYSL
jgi:hypothetical protein